jgi:CDP-diacylglycerol--glycerol-3-phosphate 3-phosphatidyltransferase
MSAPVSEALAKNVRFDVASFDREQSALILAALLATTLIGFGVRGALLGRFRDEETLQRGATRLIGMWARQYFTWMMQPIVSVLKAIRVPASVVTLLSIPLAIGSGAAISADRVATGGWLLVAASVCDYLDGRLARATRTAGPAGAVLDSVVDRYAEGAIYAGLAWLYRDSWVLLLVLLACLGSMVVPYVRARAEAVGVPMAKVGIVQRPERIVVIWLGLHGSIVVDGFWAPSPPWPRHVVLVAAMAFLGLTTHISGTQRLLHAMAELQRRVALVGKRSVARSAITSGIATGIDFLAVLALREATLLSPAVLTLVGCIIGGGAGFALSRVWTFGSRTRPDVQASRYALVSAGSAGLNSGLVALVLLHPTAPFLVAWWSVRVLVFLTWNYPLHRDYVFSESADDRDASTVPGGEAVTHYPMSLPEASGLARSTKPAILRAASHRSGRLHRL